MTYGGWVIYDKDTQKEYARFVGGLSWPTSNKKGWLVVLSEDREPDTTLEKRHIRVQTEFESINPEALIKRAYEYTKSFPDSEFYTDTSNRAMGEFLSEFEFPFYPQAAPLCDDVHSFDYYLSLIRKLTIPGKKLLHFGNSKLPGLLNVLPADARMTNSKANNYPSFLALSYALSAMDSYNPEYRRDEDREAEQANEAISDWL